eukprot:scaffold3667_cov110-Isochrysis_galbana.AAC.14
MPAAAVPKLPVNAQVEFLAPLSGVSVRLEKHNSPAWGTDSVPAHPAETGPNAAALAAWEGQKTVERQQMKGEQLARFQRDLLKRVSAAVRERRRSIAHDHQPATVESTHLAAKLLSEPLSLLEERVGQVMTETALARQLMVGGVGLAAGIEAGLSASARLGDDHPTVRSTVWLSAPRVVAVRSEWASAERQAARIRRAGQARDVQARDRIARQKAAQSAHAAAERAQAEVRREAHEAEIASRLKAEETERMLELKAARERAQKATQTERYIEARRDQLRKEVELSQRPLPPLCSCGLDALDNHVDNCARNCVFYKNPQAYSRALSGLFVRAINLV